MEDHSSSAKNGSEKTTRLLQLFVRLLHGKTAALTFTAPQVYGYQIKKRIFEVTKIPTHLQRLVCSGYQVGNGSVITQPDATVHLVLPLVGGKGGFGSLLRGAATKAGQKKTNNFDACRDMSGRRLRHVNAEKRLEEWRMEEEERKLEKIAEEFIKKKAKTGRKGAGDGEAQKYVQKYREESARCIEEVDLAVREAFGDGKRKAKAAASGSAEAKRLKIWKGKRKLEDSDSDDMDEGSDDEDGKESEKSIVLNNVNQLDSNKETEGSSGSVTGGKQDGESPVVMSCESGSEEEREGVMKQGLESVGCSGIVDFGNKDNIVVEHHKENGVQATSLAGLEAAAAGGNEASQTEKQECSGPESKHLEEVSSSSGNGEGVDSKPCDAEGNSDSDIKPIVHQENTVAGAKDVELDKPLNFDEFNSAADLEVLGMERLKSELQTRGLKCGGTLQERAVRLFLLKSTPLEKIPKKLLTKK